MLINDRRTFLKTMLMGGLALHLPFVFGCNVEDLDHLKLSIGKDNFSIDLNDLRYIQEFLYPKSHISPGAKELKSDIYFLWLVSDINVSISYRKDLVEGMELINKYTKDHFGKPFIKLSQEERTNTLETIVKLAWGERYLSNMLTVIIESMFAHPIYSSNPNKIGWKWLKYSGGFPEPQPENQYPEILNISHNN